MMRIDAHHHLWRLDRGDYDWLTPALAPLYRDVEMAELEPLLDGAGIDATILVQAAPTEAETAFLLAIATRTPRIAGVVGWTDLAAPDAAQRVAALAATPGLVGLRPMLQDMDDPAWVLRPEVAPALAAMARHGLVLDALVRAAQLPVVATLAARYPALPIVLDHAGKPRIDGVPERDWSVAIADLGGCANVAAKLSGLVTEVRGAASPALLRPYVDALLAAFGPRRMMWGSDWPVLTLASEYGAWVAMTEAVLGPLPAADRAAIWGGTAARIYAIGATRE